jgi:hypothetical protein
MTLVQKRSKIEKVNQELVNPARDVNYYTLMNSASVIRNELKRLMIFSRSESPRGLRFLIRIRVTAWHTRIANRRPALKIDG